jgi:pyridoxine 4-dehydrogenase
MDEIAAAHSKTLAQVAVNWLLTNEYVHVIPIPGMKSVRQARDNYGAADWRLTAEERSRINQAGI